MASRVTNRGLYQMLNSFFRDTDNPASFRMALVTNQSMNVRMNDISEVDQIVSGNGYTTVNGATGKSYARSGSGWDTITRNDTINYALVTMVDVQWIPTGIMPSSGLPIRWLVLCDAATPNNIIGYLDLQTTYIVANGYEFTIANLSIAFINAAGI